MVSPPALLSDQADDQSRDCPKPRSGRGSGSGMTCYRCHEEGHMASTINRLSADLQSRDCPQGGGSNDCFSCGEYGHLVSSPARECVLLTRGHVNARRSRAVAAVAAEAVTVVAAATTAVGAPRSTTTTSVAAATTAGAMFPWPRRPPMLATAGMSLHTLPLAVTTTVAGVAALRLPPRLTTATTAISTRTTRRCPAVRPCISTPRAWRKWTLPFVRPSRLASRRAPTSASRLVPPPSLARRGTPRGSSSDRVSAPAPSRLLL